MTDPVLVSIDDNGIAEVCLNRPERKNAWTFAVFDGLAAAADELMDKPGLRAVILRGAGGCFSSGLDLTLLQEFAADLEGVKAQMHEAAQDRRGNRFQRPCTSWQVLPVPVIAAIDGVCFGAGMQLALAADFRIAAPDTRFSVMEGRWGLIPDMGITQSLPKLVRADQAKDLMMSARVLEADEAQAMGLITRVESDPLAAAQAMAAELAERSPDALKQSKRLVEEAWNATADEALKLEAVLQADIIGGANQMEAVMAGMQKRKPNYR